MVPRLGIAFDASWRGCYKRFVPFGGAVAQLGARLDGIEEVVGSNPIGSTRSSVRAAISFRTFAQPRAWSRIFD